MDGEELVAVGSLVVAAIAAVFAWLQARSARQAVRRAEEAVRVAERANLLAAQANRLAEHANRQVADLEKRNQLGQLRAVLRQAAADAYSPGLNQLRWESAYRTEVQASLAGLHAQLPLCAALLNTPLPGAQALAHAVQETAAVAETTEVSAA
ncbi:hypothetical protein [Streptomyces sp. NPDC088812]|uniref:hypothetical protein n=1 Tax=Streptomyces sp. NPDC088812 TaxID=3365905 RepID=UPI00381304E2